MGMGNGVLERPVCKDGVSIDAELERIGINLQVKVNGLLVKWKSNGYIPELYGAEKAEIRLTTCGKDIWGFNVALGNNKEVTGAKIIPRLLTRKSITRLFILKMGQ